MYLRQITGAALFGICFCCMALTLKAEPAQETSKKAAAPKADAQAQAAKLIKEIYGDENAAARTPAQKEALAKKILQKARESDNDESGRYVLLRAARDIAVKADSIETAFQAIDEMDGSFQIDALKMKADVLNSSIAAARTAGGRINPWRRTLPQLLDAAIANDDFAVARQLLAIAASEAKKSLETNRLINGSRSRRPRSRNASSCTKRQEWPPPRSKRPPMTRKPT